MRKYLCSKNLERTFIVIALIGLLFKFLHLPGGSMFFILGATLLCLFYYPFGLAYLQGISIQSIFKKAAYQNTTLVISLLALFGGLALAMLLIGIQFKLQFWPGAHVNLMAGIVFIALLLLLSFLLLKSDNRQNLKRLYIRGSILLAVAIMLRLTPTPAIVDIIYSDRPCYRDTLKEVMVHPENEDAQEKLMQYHQGYLREEKGMPCP
jgi:hypothetical protein